MNNTHRTEFKYSPMDVFEVIGVVTIVDIFLLRMVQEYNCKGRIDKYVDVKEMAFFIHLN